MKTAWFLGIVLWSLQATVAFGQPDGGGSADGIGSDARFRLPTSVAVDEGGNVFVADSGNHTIRKITLGGVVTTVAGTPGTSGYVDATGSEARFAGPVGVAVDGTGTLYVADAGNSRIRRISASGVVTTLGPASGFSGSGVAVDRSGAVFVAGAGSQTIRMLAPSGVITTLAGFPGATGSADGTGGAARFNFPASVAVDDNGNVFVGDWNNHTIRKIAPGSVVTTFAGSPGAAGSVDGTGSAARFGNPSGVAVDRNGDVYVAGYGSHTIRRISSDGVVSTLAGLANNVGSADGTGGAARFYYPQGVAVDRTGNVFVADRLNHTIRKITPAGAVLTLAGLAAPYPGAGGATTTPGHAYAFTTVAGDAAFGSADGTGSAARFENPRGVAVDDGGFVFVADSSNHTIRKISAGGVVRTLAGSAGIRGMANGSGAAARFNSPSGMASDANGNLFVADSGNYLIRKITPDGVVSTFAGEAGASGRNDGLGTAARFVYPSGVAVDRDGNVFVTDPGSATVRKITAAGLVTTFAGRAGYFGSSDGTGGSAEFSYPVGVAVDANGNVYVSDSDNGTLRRITPAGVVTTVTGRAGYNGLRDGHEAALNYPTGVAVDRAGDVFVTDILDRWYDGSDDSSASGTIRRITPAGEVTTIASALRFGYAEGLAVDGRGTIVLADTGRNTIHTLSAGTVTTLAGTLDSSGRSDGKGRAARFSAPSGVAVDAGGNVFVADYRNHRIRRITAGGVVTTVADDPPGTSGSGGQFHYPAGVAVDGNGTVYVADSGHSTIAKIAVDGIVTLLAGSRGRSGSTDGAGSAATFYSPQGVAVDGAGNVFVADSGNHTIRKITREGMVTTLAGLAGSSGSADGAGGAARFHLPAGVAVGGDGAVFVADLGNHTLRKITPDGVVTTFAGTAGSNAVFSSPHGVAVDVFGNVFVADSGYSRIFRVTSDGSVAPLSGTEDPNTYLSSPQGVAVDGHGNVYVADTGNHRIRKAVPTVIVSGPQSQHIPSGADATFTVGVIGGSLRFQWKKNGVVIPGATRAYYQISRVAADDMGFYSVVVTSSIVTTESGAAILTLEAGAVSRLGNFSARGFLPAGGNFALGFVIRGSSPKTVLVRAVGPTLGRFAVPAALADPQLLLSGSAGTVLAANDDWGGVPALANAFVRVGAFALDPASSDAAVLTTLSAGAYSARVSSASPLRSGTALAEVYDLDPASAAGRLVSLSTLGLVGDDAPTLTLGFVIDGAAPKQLLIRAVGPGLASPESAAGLDDPQLAVLAFGRLIVAGNDNWSRDPAVAGAFATAGTFALPENSHDAALVVRLPPGAYTVEVSDVGEGTGRSLVEIYDLDP